MIRTPLDQLFALDLIEEKDEVAIHFHIPAAPVPKGSAKAFRHAMTGKIIVTQTNRPQQKTFEHMATPVINQAMAGKELFAGAVAVKAHYYVQRPASVKRQLPCVKPDLDKYLRMLLDVLTGKVWRDDGQVVRVEATKEYADEAKQIGVDVWVGEVEA